MTFDLYQNDLLLGFGDLANVIYYSAFPAAHEWDEYSVPLVYCSLTMFVFIFATMGVFFYGRKAFANSIHSSSGLELGPTILSGQSFQIENPLRSSADDGGQFTLILHHMI